MTRHRFDPIACVFGTLFLIVAATGMIDLDLLVAADLRWIAPSILVLVGAVLLVLSVRPHGDRDDTQTDESGTGGPQNDEVDEADEADETDVIVDRSAVEADVPER